MPTTAGRRRWRFQDLRLNLMIHHMKCFQNKKLEIPKVRLFCWSNTWKRVSLQPRTRSPAYHKECNKKGEKIPAEWLKQTIILIHIKRSLPQNIRISIRMIWNCSKQSGSVTLIVSIELHLEELIVLVVQKKVGAQIPNTLWEEVCPFGRTENAKERWIWLWVWWSSQNLLPPYTSWDVFGGGGC